MELAHIYLISILICIEIYRYMIYEYIYDICWSTLARHPLAARPVGSLQCRFALLFRCVLTRLKWSALSALAELQHPEETIFGKDRDSTPWRNQCIPILNREVQTIMGVPRVNGDLAVSRAFGDSQHKQTGGPKQDWWGDWHKPCMRSKVS